MQDGAKLPAVSQPPPLTHQITSRSKNYSSCACAPLIHDSPRLVLKQPVWSLSSVFQILPWFVVCFWEAWCVDGQCQAEGTYKRVSGPSTTRRSVASQPTPTHI